MVVLLQLNTYKRWNVQKIIALNNYYNNSKKCSSSASGNLSYEYRFQLRGVCITQMCLIQSVIRAWTTLNTNLLFSVCVCRQVMLRDSIYVLLSSSGLFILILTSVSLKLISTNHCLTSYAFTVMELIDRML